MSVTRLDVARLAGVSPAVVSYVVNDGPRPVADATRKKVESAIAELKYRPNAVASALRGGTTRLIGYLTPDSQNPYFAELGEAIEGAFLARDYLVLTGNSYYESEREQRYLRAFIDRRVDALIFASGVSVGNIRLAEEHDIPTLFMDSKDTVSTASVLRSDDVSDSAVAVEHLQQHGHWLIATIGGQPYIGADKGRLDGWRDQQTIVGNPNGDELVSFAEISEQGGYLGALSLLGEHGRPWVVHGRRPTALFVASDVQAIGALYACWELGMRVPEDVAVVSLGGTKAAAYTIPPLTTIRPDIDFMANAVASHLIDRIQDRHSPTRLIDAPVNLLIGKSCGC